MIELISLILIINIVLIIVNMITSYYNRKLIDAMIEHNNLERISQEIKKNESIRELSREERTESVPTGMSPNKKQLITLIIAERKESEENSYNIIHNRTARNDDVRPLSNEAFLKSVDAVFKYLSDNV